MELELHVEQQMYHEVKANTTQTLSLKAGPSKLFQADWARPQRGEESLWISPEFTGWEWRWTNQELFIMLELKCDTHRVSVYIVYFSYFSYWKLCEMSFKWNISQKTNFQMKGLIKGLKTFSRHFIFLRIFVDFCWLYYLPSTRQCILMLVSCDRK